eukprot:Clim_evm95s134 gene=Clim_evmTU95s134
MGIHGLAKLLGDNAPGSVSESMIKNFFGRKVAIDASMSIYQFLIAVRSDGNVLTNDAGETTSHLMGMFYRTIRMVENGIKPFYVFDGSPPRLKSGELAKRSARRNEAKEKLNEAREAGTAEDVEKFQRRLVRATKEHSTECQELLKLMGIPFMVAPCEAEAQCAVLAKEGKVFATGSEDMDALTFGTSVLLRHLTFSEQRKMPIKEFKLDVALRELDMDMDQFVDLCILLGCDYCDTIKGIGPHRALNMLREHKSLDKVLANLDTNKYKIPEDYPYDEARRLFKEPEVTDPKTVEVKWNPPDEEGLVNYMVKQKGFNEDRIRNGAKKLAKAAGTATQGRLDSFFKPKAAPAAGAKRKVLNPVTNNKNKKKK